MPDIIAYPGIPGAFSQQAAQHYFGPEHSYMGCEAFEDVVLSIIQGRAGRGLLPIENSSAGIVSDTYDLLLMHNIYIIGEVCLPVSHCLLGLQGAQLIDIREIYSHPQALSQCSVYIKALSQRQQIQIIPALNTAIAAKNIIAQQDKHRAAIASDHAAKIYNLNILKKEIEHSKANITRFVILSAKPINQAIIDKAFIAFTAKHAPGSLSKILAILADEQINLTKIESRPVINTAFEYMFYLDIAGPVSINQLSKAFESAKKHTIFFKVLGYA